MQYEPDFRFDVDESFNMCSQTMSCPSTTTSFSSASSAYDPFTPSSRRSSPHGLSLDFDHSSFGSAHPLDMTPPSSSTQFMFGPVKTEPEHMSFTDGMLPSTPMKKIEGLSTEYGLGEMTLTPHHSMGSLTPSNTFPMYTISPEAALGPTSFMMTPTQSLSGSEIDTTSSWSCNNGSPINFFPQQSRLQQHHDLAALDLERHHQQSPLGHFQLQAPPSPSTTHSSWRPSAQDVRRRTSDLQRAQIRASRKRGYKQNTSTVGVVRKASCKCDYAGCDKSFQRNEHLKRHKQTYHGEGPNRFKCDFCEKAQFNRLDNLNNHRKLHARPNDRNRGVQYVPEAVAIIEEEERSRKKRAPSKAKLAAAAAAQGIEC